MSSSASPQPKCDTRPAVPAGDRIVLTVMALLLAVQIGPWCYGQADAPGYVSIARHIAHGALRSMDSPVLWYPPGYPLLLSPLFRLRYLPLLEISVVHWFLAVALLWGTYRWARSLAPQGAVWIAALSVGTCAVWVLYRQVMSETAFMAVMVWLLVSLQALARPQDRGSFLAWLAAAVGLTIALCLIRLIGISLAAGGSCALLAATGRKRFFPNRPASEVVSWQPALGAGLLVSAAAVMTVGGVFLQGRWAEQPAGAMAYCTRCEAGGGAEILNNYGPWFALVVNEIGRITVPFMIKSYGYIGWWWDVNMLIYVPWFAMLLYGYVRWIRRSDDPLAWSLPFFLAVLTHFHSETGGRWWVPMTPAFFMCLWFALEPWGQRRRVIRAVWLAHVVTSLFYWLWVDLPRARRLDQQWPTVHRLADQITVDSNRVVIGEKVSDLGALLELQLDRRVKEHAGDAPIPAAAQWLILPSEQPPPPGFVPQSSCGNCTLLHRGEGYARK